MENKGFKLILTIIIVGSLLFGVSFAKAQTSNEEMIKILQSLIQMLTQMIAQLQQQLSQKSTPTPSIAPECNTDNDCSWCGNTCLSKSRIPIGGKCPDVMPPENTQCKCLNGKCQSVITSRTKYSCTTAMGTIPSNRYPVCIPNYNGTFNSLEECQKVCGITPPTTVFIKATDSDNSPDYLKISSIFPITPEKYPDLFVKGVGKGKYIGSNMDCIFGVEPDPEVCKPTNDNFTTAYDYCSGPNQINEAYVTSDGLLGIFGIGNIPVGYICQDGALKPVTSLKATMTGPSVLNVSETGVYRVTPSGGVPPYYYEWSADGLVNTPAPNDLPGTATYKWNKEGNYKILVTVKDSAKNSYWVEYSVSVKASCTDSDGGKNYYTKGITKDAFQYTDSCWDLKNDTRVISSTYLMEYYCGSNNLVVSELITCPTGYTCLDGVCVQQQNSCTETDGGNNVLIRGAVIYNGNTFVDTCVSNNTVKEYYCDVNRIMKDETITCGTGYICQDGACVQQLYSCTDSDGGRNYYVKGHSSGLYDNFNFTFFETDDYCGCINNDCSKRGLWEYYCKDSSVLTREAVECECNNGACTSQSENISLMDVLNRLSASLISLMELLKR